MAAYAVYRHNRVLDAIALLGAAIIVNLSATFTNLLGHLILFVVAALLLWLRAALVDRQDGWQRRRVNENLEVPAAIMRSGIVFAGASVVLAFAPDQRGGGLAADERMAELRRSLDHRPRPVRGRVRRPHESRSRASPATASGPASRSPGAWVSNDEPALTVAASRAIYLRTATYDVYTGRGFERSEGPRRQVAPGDPLFSGPTPEIPGEVEAFEAERIAILMHQTLGRNLFTTGVPLAIYAPAVIHESSGQPVLGGIEAANPIGAGEGYQVDVALSNATAAQLALAGTDYPQVVLDLYLDTPGLTTRVAQLARDVTEGAANPYEQAEALADFLHTDPQFDYQTDPGPPPPDQDLVDFFLFDEERGRIGYCQYYASAMVLMARSLGLPARVAVGLRAGRAAGGRDVPRARGERARVGRGLLPRLRLADLRGHEDDQPAVPARDRRPRRSPGRQPSTTLATSNSRTSAREGPTRCPRSTLSRAASTPPTPMRPPRSTRHAAATRSSSACSC